MTTRNKSRSHPHAAIPDAGSGSLISDARLVELYAAMLRCRILRERIRAFASPSKLRAFSSSSEAVVAAAIIGLVPEDAIISSAPHLCAALLKGVPLESILRPFRTRPKISPDASDGADVSSGFFVAPSDGADRLIFSTGALAAGVACACKRDNRNAVALAFYEDSGGKAPWPAIFAFALAHQLPLICIRHASRQFQQAPRRGKSRRSLGSIPGALPIIPVDSNDAVAVYRVVHEAISHARRGSGPTLIDCVPLRLPGERKRDSDCIVRMERYLEAKGLRPDRIRAAATAKFTRAIGAAVAATRSKSRAKRSVRRSGKSGN
ncbi:MAG TPA: thiamine pyrophosphate-dependent enzyme [Terracidiphilus sp.]|nr:thiamine pyrophosphate-dependent enzyme [Terracidiphilus sp.]